MMFNGKTPGRGNGFTLVELLIVVGIIALLAAIAVPNFLEAQIRAKTTRAKSDLRTIAGSLAAYRIDQNSYPPNDGFAIIIPSQLTTPIAYLQTNIIMDPFRIHTSSPIFGNLIKVYTYSKIVDRNQMIRDTLNGFAPSVEAVDMFGMNPGALGRYGGWRLVSYGPDEDYIDGAQIGDTTEARIKKTEITYDPTNGTVSLGNIIRTEKSTTGIIGP